MTRRRRGMSVPTILLSHLICHIHLLHSWSYQQIFSFLPLCAEILVSPSLVPYPGRLYRCRGGRSDTFLLTMDSSALRVVARHQSFTYLPEPLIRFLYLLATHGPDQCVILFGILHYFIGSVDTERQGVPHRFHLGTMIHRV